MLYIGIILLILGIIFTIVGIKFKIEELKYVSMFVAAFAFICATTITSCFATGQEGRSYYIQYNSDNDTIETVEEPGEYVLIVKDSFDILTFEEGERYTLKIKGSTVGSCKDIFGIKKIKKYFRNLNDTQSRVW